MINIRGFLTNTNKRITAEAISLPVFPKGKSGVCQNERKITAERVLEYLCGLPIHPEIGLALLNLEQVHNGERGEDIPFPMLPPANSMYW